MDDVQAWLGFLLQLVTGIVIVVAVYYTRNAKHDEKILTLIKSIDRLTEKMDKVVDRQIDHKIRINRLEDGCGKNTSESIR